MAAPRWMQCWIANAHGAGSPEPGGGHQVHPQGRPRHAKGTHPRTAVPENRVDFVFHECRFVGASICSSLRGGLPQNRPIYIYRMHIPQGPRSGGGMGTPLTPENECAETPVHGSRTRPECTAGVCVPPTSVVRFLLSFPPFSRNRFMPVCFENCYIHSTSAWKEKPCGRLGSQHVSQ